MGKYLTKFANHSAYESAESGLILPNVSLCAQEGDVHYKPYDPYNGHAYVDLGLPSGTKWATMNIGANSETDSGNYYQYGKGVAQYAVTSGDSMYSGTENPLATSADTAAQVWGGEWHMPTSAQCQELIDNTTYEIVTDYQGSGINGATFTANGQTIFIPNSGHYWNGNKRTDDNAIWTSTPHDRNVNDSYVLHTTNSSAFVDTMYGSKLQGWTIRPVVG